MKLPVEKLETKNYTIGQEVLMVKHFEGGIEIKKKGLVIAITDKTLIVKSNEEMIFTEHTMSVQGEYVLFPSVEAYQNYVHNYNKFEMKKKELMNKIGDLTEGLDLEDVQLLIDAVETMKEIKSGFNPEVPCGMMEEIAPNMDVMHPNQILKNVADFLATTDLINGMIPKGIKVVKMQKE